MVNITTKVSNPVYTIKPVLRGHLLDKYKFVSMTGDLLIEIFYNRTRKW